jgi:hypothetical protein
MELSKSLSLPLCLIVVAVFFLDIEVYSAEQLLKDGEDKDFFGERDFYTVSLINLGGAWTVNIIEMSLV